MAYLRPLEPVDGRRRFEALSPVDREPMGTVVVHTAADVAAAVTRARDAQHAWGERTPKQRAKALQKAIPVLVANRDRYLDVMTRETGRPRLDSLMIEIFAALDSLNYYSGRAAKVLGDRTVGLHLLRMKKAKITYRPLGVVGVISPWNGPFILSLNPAVQALLAGNAVIIKPSEVTPFSGLLVEELFRDAGLPPGLVQVLTGDGETGAALLEAGVDKITFTGSVATGRKVGEACGRNLIPCTLELGGKDPMIVCADADIDRAAGGAVFGAVMNTGQFCSSTERIYVLREVAEAFIDKVVDKVKALEVGRDVGPFIFEKQCDIVERHVDDAVAKGATVRAGGERQGDVYLPTVLTGVTHDMDVMRDETFGPILPIMVVDSEDEAIRLANDTVYGLGASVWTKDVKKAERLAKRLIAGAVNLNDSSVTYGALEVPFGGRKQSGVGRTNGAGAILNYAHPMPMIRDRFTPKEDAVWYPYTDDKVASLEKAVGVIWGTPLKWLIR